MAIFSNEATKWGAISAVSCFAIFAILVGVLFSTGQICTADYGNDGTSISACAVEESLASRIGRISSDEDTRQLASAIAGDEALSLAVAEQIHSEFPKQYRDIANIQSSADETNFYTTDDTRLIEELSSRFDDFSDIDGNDRFTEIERRIAQVPLWQSLRDDAKGRRTLFRPIADGFEATKPRVAPEACSIFSKVPGPFVDGDLVYLESADGNSAVVREVIADVLEGASYQFQLNGNDATKLRLARGRQQTRGTVYARPASNNEIENLYNPCRDANPIEEPSE